MKKKIKFNELSDSDLFIDALYKSGDYGNVKDDPISKILNVGNQGGFRIRGNAKDYNLNYVILYSDLTDRNWPDYINNETGRFIYFGDNKKPGYSLHDTNKNGNLILKKTFNLLHNNKRMDIPPFFIFTKGVEGRDVIFKGLAVPGSKELNPSEDLVAIWKTKNNERFQNYKSIFTILDVAKVSRKWLVDLENNHSLTKNAPEAWVKWTEKGIYKPLKAEKTVRYRIKEEQLPKSKNDIEKIEVIYNYFKNAYKFERFAVEIVKLMDNNVLSCDLTRPWLDGGRDALGKYKIGYNDNYVKVDFAIEAKRYKINNSVKIRDTTRLISRLRYRQFGILVTTSYVSRQAYKEIVEDGHPIIILSSIDIIKILKQADLNTLSKIKHWLKDSFDS